VTGVCAILDLILRVTFGWFLTSQSPLNHFQSLLWLTFC